MQTALSVRNPPGQRYNATERRWVRELLAKLTPAERLEYERRIAMGEAERHPHNGKLYDGEKGRIAEEVRYDFAVGRPTGRKV